MKFLEMYTSSVIHSRSILSSGTQQTCASPQLADTLVGITAGTIMASRKEMSVHLRKNCMKKRRQGVLLSFRNKILP
jgi:hypothetical protein